jgi:hypothetical protein
LAESEPIVVKKEIMAVRIGKKLGNDGNEDPKAKHIEEYSEEDDKEWIVAHKTGSIHDFSWIDLR